MTLSNGRRMVDPYNLGALLTLSHYRAFQCRLPLNDIEELDVQIEELDEELSQTEASGKKIKLWKAAPSGHKATIEPRAAQIWAKRLREDPIWNIYEKQTNKVSQKPSRLQQEHK
ncbi:hypothetical protein INT47_009432 [Mucor saturninus]|uniref:Uncharacterized protein n=1 Tax=Mucor saturninus TaxID=64648 RepID=A0A8H7QW50_9FUNG|nr:hypothetical protein INT47_009432 [Mucor saturninus]